MKSIPLIAEEVALIGPRIGRKIMADLLYAADIPPAQFFVLMMLFHLGAIRFSNICHEMKISAPTATGIVSRLVKSGYVKRIADKQDRRAITVELTPEGRKFTQKLRGLVVARWTEILSKIPHEDAEKYLDILKKISEGL